MFEKIFNKKTKQEEDTVETTEEVIQEIEPEKSLEYYEEKKHELKELYNQRSNEAVNYQNKKDRIDSISPDELLNSQLTEQAHASTLGNVNEKIKEISEEGVGLTKQEHYEAREKMLQDELERVNEKIEEFKQKEIYPGDESAQQLLSLKETVGEIWNKDISNEKGYEILREVYGDNNVFERSYTNPSEILPTEVIKGINTELESISNEFSNSDKYKNIEYRKLVERKQKLSELLTNWDSQSREKAHN